MDLKKTKPSKNFEDHTGRGEVVKFLDFLFTSLNPAYAYDKIKYRKRNKQGLSLQNQKPSENFVDRTNRITPQYDWRDKIFWQLMQQHYQDGMRGDGSLTLQDPKTYQKPILNK